MASRSPSVRRVACAHAAAIRTKRAGRSRTFSGTSRSSQRSQLSFKVGGTIESLPVEVGERLRRGQTIATLADDELELQAERAEADLALARANQRNAEASYERTQDLYTDNNASKSDLDAARASAESARAQVGAAEKQLELARLNIGYTRLAAATDCSVATVEVEVNENVSPGTPVATVDCGDLLEVELAIPEGLIHELATGMEARVRFPAFRDRVVPGTLTEVGIAARGGTTFPVIVGLDGDTSNLRSGLAAEVTLRFAVPGDGDTFLLPLQAVVEGSEGAFVFLAEPTEKGGEAVVRQRPVTLGELTERGIEVRSGLTPGDRVITAGTSVVRDGLRVLLDGEQG